jgi:ATP-dependent DNA helicase RecG
MKTENSPALGDLPVTVLKGVGPSVAEKLARLDLHTIQDLLLHLPYRYQDRTRIVPIGSLLPGIEALIVGNVEITDVVYRKKRSMLCRVSDGTGFITLRFFYFSGKQQQRLSRGTRLRCFGEVRNGPNSLEIIHPEYEILGDDEQAISSDALTPFYPATEGVQQQTLRKLITQAIEKYLPELTECLPEKLLNELNLPSLQDALRAVHQPDKHADTEALLSGNHPLQQRLSFEELLAHQVSLKTMLRKKQKKKAPAISNTGKLKQKFISSLGFSLTGAQNIVIGEIENDLQLSHPMQRLVQGDVGCGKTVVAAAAALRLYENGYQTVIMAPTELLSEQHFNNFKAWMPPLGIHVVVLQGKQKAAERKKALAEIASGKASIIIGTHALFQTGVDYKNLGLVVVDEQHRFGVHQRLTLLEKGEHDNNTLPHQLVMTATPIPRTLAQTLYADLDVSIIDELPPGRKPVKTVAISSARRGEVVKSIEQACQKGQQVYWVCPLIEESEALQLQTATETELVLKEMLPDIRIAMVHGRLAGEKKETIMRDFKNHDIDCLVATTVVEVGVDVPNASLMVIENSERLGLSQLHQLRGRVGRGTDEANCILLYKTPLSELAKNRLQVMRETNDGFEIARKDLEFRGPGEMFGTRQTGMARFRIADLMRDQELLPQVQKVCQQILNEYPQVIEPLLQRWLQRAGDYNAV